MTDADHTLREQVSRSWKQSAGEEHPSFERVWQMAQNRQATARRRYRRFASLAAVAAVIVIGLNAPTPMQESYVEVADLLESTYWSAPSDVLLPHREFDLYQDMPVIFESTEPAGGALL